LCSSAGIDAVVGELGDWKLCSEDWKEERESSWEENRADMEEMTGPLKSPFTQQYPSLLVTYSEPWQEGSLKVMSEEEEEGCEEVRSGLHFDCLVGVI